ncbi:hypothetical protein BBO99_00008233 [Phytophthora kernoviae]|uniref:Thioesterase domain-containing protein n=2 Tax=Phytophthora kernoviae TaxID=325452 RepID=A0A421FE82_9STRA|nr:hypothetical protein G195_010734 [Phytophthora kernoviae 00238/432]KAG2508745.1 hypothetical protein JM18_009111 [Phytophthora kernoviae]KAG2512341.1 hypothetical protein JM16_008120 [Phytophthora kernoviae]RLN38411.1 hypothetical protein BBI17_009241 [Phytophthora kernoviae]RLN75564.1 hypothetical protein BBO99_00008233 [Phytophthora kernoviae]
MVLRMLWNISSGLVHGVLHKNPRPGLVGLHYPAIWRGRTGFLDCDVNLHLNNSSYLFSMELARWHFTASNGILWQAVKHRRMFLVASQSIRYRHGIPPFHAYEIRTQVVHWDDHWVYFLHQFQCPATGKQYAEGLSRVLVKQRGKGVLFDKLIAEVYDGPIPPPPSEVPAVVKGFLEWDAASRDSMESAYDAEKPKITSKPPQKTPEKLGARIWEEMRRSMNLP